MQNKLFIENPQKFYKGIGPKQIKFKTPPNQYEIERFWKSLHENPLQHDHQAGWIQ